MSGRIISISAAPYDGYEFPAMLDSIASCGAQYVEPAFIVGYTEPFDESNAASRTNADGFFRNIRILAAHAERLEMIIGLENPGNGEDNLFNLAEDGLRLLEQLGSPHVRLNYDAGNTVSHRPGQVDPAKDALVALPGCGQQLV
jgi:sugar phosphate isomerase/epimerase